MSYDFSETIVTQLLFIGFIILVVNLILEILSALLFDVLEYFDHEEVAYVNYGLLEGA